MIKKEFSIIIPIKNRTSIAVDYEPIPLRVIQRNNINLSGLPKKEIKLTKDGKIILDLLLNFLESISVLKQEDELFEIIITDFGSDDYDMKKLIKKFPKLQIKVINADSHFSRGKGLNIGFKHITKENVFFCDADMLLTTRQLFDVAYEKLNDGKVLFPVCFGLCEPSHQIGYFRNSGFGMCMLKKEVLINNGYCWSEYDSLGKEDDDFWNFFNNKGLCCRLTIDGYYHQWHPESQEFKNRYYKYNDIKKQKIFLNFPENHFSDIVINDILDKCGYNVNGDVYIVHKLEKFINIVISVSECKNPIVTDEEINFYIEKHNKKLKRHIVDTLI